MAYARPRFRIPVGVRDFGILFSVTLRQAGAFPILGNGIGRELSPPPAAGKIVVLFKQQGADEADDAGLTNWSFGH
jgi:hypothetical protein